MKVALNMREVAGAVASAKREAAASFGDDRVLMERYITRPRHVEVQRRHQKVIEEAPAPGLSDLFHATIGDAAVKAAKACGYVNAGTVEFIVDADSPTKEFFFMEMNTRLQVEHPVTEAVSGVDLVEWQLIVAAGMPLPRTSQEAVGNPHGHAFEARLYAESPRNNFLPGAGTVHRWRPPTDAVSFSHLGGAIRVDSGVHEGDDVGINYAPIIDKVMCWDPDKQTVAPKSEKPMFPKKDIPQRPVQDQDASATFPAMPDNPMIVSVHLLKTAGRPVMYLYLLPATAYDPMIVSVPSSLTTQYDPMIVSILFLQLRAPHDVSVPFLQLHTDTMIVIVPSSCKLQYDRMIVSVPLPATAYDPMIAKVVCWGPDRSTALKTLRHALANTQVSGLPLNLHLRRLAAHPSFKASGDELNTAFMQDLITCVCPHIVCLVSGLPLNLHFLRRLAAHPSFEAAGDELTTAFIATHKDELMKPQALPAHVAAIAAIARHQIMVAKQKMASPPSATAAMGPWAIADGKRLWGCQVLDFKDMSFPEGEGAAHAKLSLRVTVNSSTSFEVVCPNGDASANDSVSDMVRDEEWIAAMHCIKAKGDGRKVVCPNGDASGDESVSVMLRDVEWSAAMGNIKAKVDGRKVVCPNGDASKDESISVMVRHVKWSAAMGNIKAKVDGRKVVCPNGDASKDESISDMVRDEEWIAAMHCIKAEGDGRKVVCPNGDASGDESVSVMLRDVEWSAAMGNIKAKVDGRKVVCPNGDATKDESISVMVRHVKWSAAMGNIKAKVDGRKVVCPNGDASKDESISVMVRDVEWSAAMDSIKAEVDGRKVHADVSFHRHGAMEDVLSLWMQEDSEMESYEFRWPVQTWSKDAMAGSHSAAGGGKVVSPMPGRVVKLLVAAGDKVTVGAVLAIVEAMQMEHQIVTAGAVLAIVEAMKTEHPIMVTAGAVLAIVEAMKMEHPIVATCDGIVNDLTVSPGAQILDGQALMWIEKEAAETS
eukprot:gene10371-8311_t